MDVKLNKEFIDKYITMIAEVALNKPTDESFNTTVTKLIEDIYTAGFNDGQEAVYKMRCCNVDNTQVTPVKYTQCELQLGKKYKCYRPNGTYVSLYYHGTPSGELFPVFSERLNLVVSDDWYKVSEFCWFELDVE